MNVADQKALQEQPNNIMKVDSLERPWNAVMKDYSVPSKADYGQSKQFLVISLAFVVCLLVQMKMWRIIMARA